MCYCVFLYVTVCHSVTVCYCISLCVTCALLFYCPLLCYFVLKCNYVSLCYCVPLCFCLLMCATSGSDEVNPLNAELNPICHLLALLGAHHILHVNRIRVNAELKDQKLSWYG